MGHLLPERCGTEISARLLTDPRSGQEAVYFASEVINVLEEKAASGKRMSFAFGAFCEMT
jgi:hypothetical protein